MMNLRSKLVSFLKLKSRAPVITEQSTLKEIESLHMGVWKLLEDKYHLTRSQLNAEWSLSFLCKHFDLPPAQIVFMEIQLSEKSSRVEQITAVEAKELMEANKNLLVLDVREAWERDFGALPHSQTLDKNLLKKTLKTYSKSNPILVYCHFGVRSLDAAHHLMNEGFNRVYTIRGGIDAWSVQVDSSIPRYSGSYC